MHVWIRIHIHDWRIPDADMIGSTRLSPNMRGPKCARTHRQAVQNFSPSASFSPRPGPIPLPNHDLPHHHPPPWWLYRKWRRYWRNMQWHRQPASIWGGLVLGLRLLVQGGGSAVARRGRGFCLHRRGYVRGRGRGCVCQDARMCVCSIR